MKYILDTDNYYEYNISSNIAVDLEYLAEIEPDTFTLDAIEFLDEIAPHGYVFDIVYDEDENVGPLNVGFGWCDVSGCLDSRWRVRITPFILEEEDSDEG